MTSLENNGKKTPSDAVFASVLLSLNKKRHIPSCVSTTMDFHPNFIWFIQQKYKLFTKLSISTTFLKKTLPEKKTNKYQTPIFRVSPCGQHIFLWPKRKDNCKKIIKINTVKLHHKYKLRIKPELIIKKNPLKFCIYNLLHINIENKSLYRFIFYLSLAQMPELAIDECRALCLAERCFHWEIHYDRAEELVCCSSVKSHMQDSLSVTQQLMIFLEFYRASSI